MDRKINQEMKYTLWLSVIGFWGGSVLSVALVWWEKMPFDLHELLRMEFLAAASTLTLAGMGFCMDLLRQVRNVETESPKTRPERRYLPQPVTPAA